ncbi:hypothetical protein [Salinicola aestuarinus]|uniref:hypothetical protein n=1 Tax=Salinicola aestuarinus TaxID=1949082 RepID=UPI000DA21AA9|nr:hypothetical protein [Salinicola aestuarinus]
MKKQIFAASVATLFLGFAGSAFAQSTAMQEAYDATSEPLTAGSGITADGSMIDGDNTGHSEATNASLDAIEAETGEMTQIANAEALDELNAEGQSVQAGESLKAQ